MTNGKIIENQPFTLIDLWLLCGHGMTLKEFIISLYIDEIIRKNPDILIDMAFGC